MYSTNKFKAIRLSSFDPGGFVDLETFFAHLFRLLWIASRHWRDPYITVFQLSGFFFVWCAPSRS